MLSLRLRYSAMRVCFTASMDGFRRLGDFPRARYLHVGCRACCRNPFLKKICRHAYTWSCTAIPTYEHVRYCHAPTHHTIRSEIEEMQKERAEQTETMLDNIRDLSRQLRLSMLMIDHYVPPEHQDQIEQRCQWNEEIGEWHIEGKYSKPVPHRLFFC